MTAPLLIMLSGPNDAGKSTFYESHLKALGLPFLNADNLARETGMNAYDAAATIATVRDQLIKNCESFVTETVFSDPVRERVQVLADAVGLGFDVTLIYIGIESSDLSRLRVGARVAAGGHDVPVEKLEGRYRRSLENLHRAVQQLPRVRVYDNSSFDSPHRFLGEFRHGKIVKQPANVVPIPEWALGLFESD